MKNIGQKEFKDYVRESAFNLRLSFRQIHVLLYLDGSGWEDEKLNLAPYIALQRRGLIRHVKDKGFELTREGVLVAELLQLAGYTETPNPNSVESKNAAKTN